MMLSQNKQKEGHKAMPVMDYLERNAKLYPDEVALVELNPEEQETRRISWKEYDLIEPSRFEPYRGRLRGRFLTKKPTGSLIC